MLSKEQLRAVYGGDMDEFEKLCREPIFDRVYTGKVYSKGRPRFSGNGHAFTPKNTRNFEKAVREWSRKGCGAVVYCPIKVHVHLYDKLPKALSTLERELAVAGLYFSQVGDVDNRAKSILDACNGTVYADDCQIAGLTADRAYAAESGFRLRVYRCGLSQNEIFNMGLLK